MERWVLSRRRLPAPGHRRYSVSRRHRRLSGLHDGVIPAGRQPKERTVRSVDAAYDQVIKTYSDSRIAALREPLKVLAGTGQ